VIFGQFCGKKAIGYRIRFLSFWVNWWSIGGKKQEAIEYGFLSRQAKKKLLMNKYIECFFFK
jgi:hypothetical protein